MSAGRVAAAVVLLLGALTAGVWLGGHPAKLPQPLREAFISDTGGVTVEAGELIEDNYYRSVSAEELSNASLEGMARGLRRRYDDRFSEYLSPELLERFNEAISGRFSGMGSRPALARICLRRKAARSVHASRLANVGIVSPHGHWHYGRLENTAVVSVPARASVTPNDIRSSPVASFGR